VNPKTESGHISDIVHLPRRRDWSHLRDDLATLGPGQLLSIRVPSDITVKNLRSTVLVIGRRLDFGDKWILVTKSEKSVIHCFLAPR
jgi:hypothetical protein